MDIIPGAAGKRALGNRGEALAAEFLRQGGMEILARNYRKAGGEIDIVAKDGAVVAFVEVKTRTSESFAAPRESVGGLKRKRLRAAAEKWLMETGYDGFCRFDVVEVILAEEAPLIRHWRDAF